MTFPFAVRSVGLLLLAASLFATPARAGILWYNGDNDNRDSLDNYAKVPVSGTSTLTTSLVYDNFVVTSPGWIVTSVYSDNMMSFSGTPSKATWQIRSGVSSGNGGTLVASGDTTATYTVLTPYNQATGFTEERVTATVASVYLAPGSYWLAVAPDSASTAYYSDQSYIETTSGANAIGSPPGNDGNSYITSNYPIDGGTTAYNYTPTTTALDGDGDGPNIDFSMGVSGSVVPEPSSLILTAIAAGLIAPAVVLRRRRASRAV